MSRAGVAPVTTLRGFPRKAARDQATQNLSSFCESNRKSFATRESEEHRNNGCFLRKKKNIFPVNSKREHLIEGLGIFKAQLANKTK
jgi:hypothetical protein